MTIKEYPSITQYDSQFKVGSFTNERSACALFSQLTAKKFLDDKSVDIETHNKIVDCSVANFLDLNSSGFMNFNQFLKLFKNDDYLDNDVEATSVDLIVQNIVGFDSILPQDVESYAVVFLKNGKYFVVMKDKDNYFIRDCHEKEQYDFDSREEIINHLNKAYQFNKKIDLSGEGGNYEVPEWSSIEFLVLNGPISTVLDTERNLVYKSPEEMKKEKGTVFKIKFPANYYPKKFSVPKDHQIDHRDDIIVKGQTTMQEDADAQMALALQQAEFGDKDINMETLMKNFNSNSN